MPLDGNKYNCLLNLQTLTRTMANEKGENKTKTNCRTEPRRIIKETITPQISLTQSLFDQRRHFIQVQSAVDCSTTTASDGKRENQTKTDCRTEPSRDIKETIKLHAADIEGSLPSQLPDMSIKSSTALRKSTKLRIRQRLVLSIFTFL